VAGVAVVACPKADEPSDEAHAEPASAAAPIDPTAAVGAPALRMFDWLDPDAIAVTYSRLPPEIDPDPFSVVFALPPRVARMLRDVSGVADGLDAVLSPSAPRPDTWLGPQALASTPRLASGTYVLRPLTKPRAEVEAMLQDAGMQQSQVEGFSIYLPQGPFPWKVAFVEDDIVAFIPVKEIGSGLGPLTAGRDLPPSEVETELRKALQSDPNAVLELYAVGPLLHFDLGQDVLQLMMRVRPWDGDGLSVELRLQPSEDPDQAVATLENRKTPLESDQIQALVDRVAFTLDGPTVEGHLQLTSDDLSVLRGAT
jgi:hypothetical protein